MDFEKIADILEEISMTSSVREREAILRRNAKVEGFKELLQYLYNPYITTGLKRAKLNRAATMSVIDRARFTPEAVINYFSKGATGSNADAEYANGFISQYKDPTLAWLAEGLMTKDFQCGVSTTTLNNVFGAGFIPKIGIMRGRLAPEHFTGAYIATEKIDGNRRLFFNFGTHVETYTRSGHRDTGLKEIEQEIAEKLPANFMYDCECVALGDFVDNIALRQATASILNSGSQNKTGVKALCFDMVEIPAYNRGAYTVAAIYRKAMLANLFGDYTGAITLSGLAADALNGECLMDSRTPVQCKHIAALPILGIVRNEQEAQQLAGPIWKSGGEGLMLVDYKSSYVVSATPKKEWLKIKATVEWLGKVIDVYEGTGNFTGMLGGVTVGFLGPDKKLYTCNVGSGFTQAERCTYLTNPEKIIGKIIEIDCFGFSQAQGSTGYSLNCPIFKRIRGQVD